MKLNTVLLCILVGVAITSAEQKVRYDNYAVYKVTIKNAIQLSIAKGLDTYASGFSIWRWNADKEFDVMVSPLVSARFKTLMTLYNFETKEVIPNVQKLIDDEAKVMSANSTAKSSSFGWDSYHSLDEIYAWMDEMAAKYPTKVEIIVIGKSHEGREIRCMYIHRTDNIYKSTVFIEANSVASEWITSAVATMFINDILQNLNSLLYDYYILPVLNVDGFVYSHKTDRLWRKNRNPILPPTCIGTDLTRNYDYMYDLNYGYAPNATPCSQFYMGNRAFSEAESSSLANFVRKKYNIGLFISLRAYGQHVAVPYSYTRKEVPEDFDVQLDVANSAATTMKNKHGEEYTVDQASYFVQEGIAAGSTIDWAVEEIVWKTAVLAIILRDKGQYGYLLPASYIRVVGEEAISGMRSATYKAGNHLYL